MEDRITVAKCQKQTSLQGFVIADDDLDLIDELAAKLGVAEEEAVHRALMLLDASEQRSTRIRMSGGAAEAVKTEAKPQFKVSTSGVLLRATLAALGGAVAAWLMLAWERPGVVFLIPVGWLIYVSLIIASWQPTRPVQRMARQ